jgi:hypothetical protein
MTEPHAAMTTADQNRLTRAVGRALLGLAPPGWKQIRVDYRCAGRHIEVDLCITGPDGHPRPLRPPIEVVNDLGRLRHAMYRPGRGTWLSAVYLIEPPSRFSAEFEPDLEPRWRRTPPPIGFQDELRFYPRAEMYTPDWLRDRAGLPPLTAAPAAPTPPDPARPGTAAGSPSGYRPPP